MNSAPAASPWPAPDRRAEQIDALAPEAKEAARETGLDDNQAALLKAKANMADAPGEMLNRRAAVRARAVIQAGSHASRSYSSNTASATP
jgi:hypothetical protein